MLEGTPYSLEEAAWTELSGRLRAMSERVALLRSTGRLTRETLRHYFGERRFEQIAESNAIEGSTLSAGETQLAVMRGVTITGHEPRFSDDARSLASAFDAVNEIARDPSPTDMRQVREVHRHVLSGHPQAGSFRTEAVTISGAAHVPPRTGLEVQMAMQVWSDWSRDNPTCHPVLRSAVLHAWLTHIHPFVDGNGRSARAIGNLELIRAGYPSIVIKKTKHRDRYIDALGASDADGNLGPFLDLILDRAEDALRDLERAATTGQGYSAERERLRKRQQGKLTVWNAALELLLSRTEFELAHLVEQLGGEMALKRFRDALSLDEYLQLCDYKPISDAWAARIELRAPALRPVTRLAWIGFRSEGMLRALPRDSATDPSIFWSVPNVQRFPPWVRALPGQGPAFDELTLVDDTWYGLRFGGLSRMTSVEAAQAITRGISHLASG